MFVYCGCKSGAGSAAVLLSLLCQILRLHCILNSMLKTCFANLSSSFCPHFLDQTLTATGQLPVRFKEFWGLPLADRGIDSLALNLSVAVQAKDYEKFVPLNRLATWLGGIARAHQMWIPIEQHGTMIFDI